MLGTCVVVIALAGVPQVHRAAPPPECELEVLTPAALDEKALAEFNTAVEAYVQLHRQLERQVPPQQTSDNPETILRATEALGDAIRAARPLATRGNLVGPGAARLFRRTIAETLQAHQYAAGDVIASLNEEPLPGARRPTVNGRYDWGLGAWMWPALIHALPVLPDELEYRLVGPDLVIIDLHANLVVDILDDAIAVDED